MSDAMETAQSDLGFDPNSLRAKYREERDKRLRSDGNDQYKEVVGDFKHYIDDPYVEPGFSRAPLTDEVDVIIIGGGFGGLLAGARLRQAGVKDIRIIEKGGDFGGTWYWNRYPGAACDIEAYVYLPLLEETGYIPKRKFTPAKEILEHSRRIAKQFDLYDNACLQTEITELRWDEDSARWIVKTNRDDAMKARFVIMSNGPLNRPKLPGIDGITDYKGHTFHTSRWDYAYTGGNAEGGLTGLKGKRVAIIGTGATAVQCVPHVGEMADELYVFQRTPSSIDVRDDQPTDDDWAKSLKPGWHQERMDNFNILVSGGVVEKDLVNDGWTEIIRNILLLAQKPENKNMDMAKLSELAEIADFQKMNQIRARVDEVVEDKETAEALKPWYRQFCKRPCFHDDYLPTFNQPNVHLIDTKGQGVDKITEKGVVAGGKEYEVDCIIFATGFEVGTGYTRRSGYDLYGRGGETLSHYWDDGVKSLHGLFVHGFPNVFVMAGPQAGFTANYPHMLDEHAQHIAYILDRALGEQIRTLEVTEDAQEAWVKTIIDKAQMRMKFLEECTPGYYNNEGRPNERAAQNGFYGAGSPEYFAILKAWRDAGDMPGLELQRN